MPHDRAVLLALTGLATLGAGLALSGATPATAQESRFAPRPPVVLSPNLTEPWMLQLRPRYRDMTDAALPAPAPAMPAPIAIVAPVATPEPEPAVVAAPAPRSGFFAAFGLAPTPESHVDQQVPAPAARRAVREVRDEFLPTVVPYRGPHAPGTIVIDTNARHLFLVQEGGTARRYGVGVGRPGFEWAGEHRVTRKAEWPSWRPPAEMLKRQPKLPRFMEGGPGNPLGARAMYLGSSMYRIHGSNEPWTIGQAVSSGCIRMLNEDVIDLYERVRVGTRVVVVR